jgi:hypothetical protein
MTAATPRQFELLPADQITSPDGTCRIMPVGRRRNGHMRYWCIAHKADATGKHGQILARCRGADTRPISTEEMLTLDLDQFEGGVALWGAVPPVYDTTRLPLDRGIHVHAREAAGGVKVHDQTFRAVTLIGRKVPTAGITISEIDAVYFMVSSIFGFGVRYIECSVCGYPHLDVKRRAIGTPDRHAKRTPLGRRDRLVPVANGRDPRGAERPPRVRRSGAREGPVCPPGQAGAVRLLRRGA